MEMQMRKQIMCCMLAVILFLSGMCVELPSADISFLHAKESVVTSTKGSVISDGTRFSRLEKVCTIETLNSDTATCLSSIRRGNLGKRFQRNVALLLAVATLLTIIFYCDNRAVLAPRKARSSHITIVRYIQQTDGKK